MIKQKKTKDIFSEALSPQPAQKKSHTNKTVVKDINKTWSLDLPDNADYGLKNTG